MHVLKKFSPKEQEFIVNNGILLLKQCKLFNTITINQDENVELKIQKNKNAKLLTEMEQIEDKLNEKREKEIREIKNKYDMEIKKMENAINKKDESIENIEERTINKKDRENVEIKGMYETRIKNVRK
jgi:esterase/lipase